jgi:hypothetical protein
MSKVINQLANKVINKAVNVAEHVVEDVAKAGYNAITKPFRGKNNNNNSKTSKRKNKSKSQQSSQQSKLMNQQPKRYNVQARKDNRKSMDSSFVTTINTNDSIVRNNTRSQHFVSRGKERFGTILGNNTTVIAPQVFHITPANKALLPLESIQSALYQQYRIKRFVISAATESFQISSSSAVAGKIIISSLLDPDAVTPSTDVAMENSSGSVSAPAFRGVSFDLLRAYPQIRKTTFWMDPTVGSDSKLTIAASVYITSLNTSVDNTVAIAELYVDYEFEYLNKVQPPNSLTAQAYSTSIVNTSSSGDTGLFDFVAGSQQFPPFGTLEGQGAGGTDTSLFTVDGNNLYFPVLGVGIQWVIDITYLGTAITQAVFVNSYGGMNLTQFKPFANGGSNTYQTTFFTSTAGFHRLAVTQTASNASINYGSTATTLSNVNMQIHAVPKYSLTLHVPMTTTRMIAQMEQRISGKVEDEPIFCCHAKSSKNELTSSDITNDDNESPVGWGTDDYQNELAEATNRLNLKYLRVNTKC